MDLGDGAGSDSLLSILRSQLVGAPDPTAMLNPTSLPVSTRTTDPLLSMTLSSQIQKEEEALLARRILLNKKKLDYVLLNGLSSGVNDVATKVIGSTLAARSAARQAAVGVGPRSALHSTTYLPLDLQRRSSLDVILAAQAQNTQMLQQLRNSGAGGLQEQEGRRYQQLPAGGASSTGNRKPHQESFPEKLHRILDDAAAEGNEHIISFFDDGKVFAVHNVKKFVEQIMPRYLSTVRYSSFQRQLNLYGFRRVVEGRDKSGFYHESFRRGYYHLCPQIKRRKQRVPAGGIARRQQQQEQEEATLNNELDEQSEPEEQKDGEDEEALSCDEAEPPTPEDTLSGAVWEQR
uniref:HSF-type DNA-binding domain-containing protein n=1 Tax=Grammatophora oceanica TaxID=210454 RepID=A0A7S1UVD3_9STRA|mmetsp:Transcript_25373/g.37058  ORF Transcript_25373/g.37058 Transcript_25373/m.37058 type:complete len:348 (+) Transcript_25373:2-1045(+)